MQIKIEEIIIPKRVRIDLGDISPLARSLEKYGQLNPITLTPQRELIAGHRRLEAAKLLGWETINVKIVANLSEKERLEIEIDENLHRKPFTDEELENAYEKLNKISNPNFFQKILKWLTQLFKWIFKNKKKK